MDMQTETRVPAAAGDDRAAAEAALATPSPEHQSWEAACTRHAEAKAAYEAADALANELWESVRTAVPVPTELRDGDGYLVEHEIDQLPRAPATYKAHLKSVLQQHLAALDAARTECGYEASTAALEKADNEYVEARAVLLAAPVTHVAGLIIKLNEFIWAGEDLDDADHVQEILTRADYSDKSKLAVYRDAARLAGLPIKTGDVQAWDVDGFVQTFLACHRGEWDNRGTPSWFADGSEPFSPSRELWADLSDWKKGVVKQRLSTIARPSFVAQLEADVRKNFRAWEDPLRDLACITNRGTATGADYVAVQARIGDLIAAHATYRAGQSIAAE